MELSAIVFGFLAYFTTGLLFIEGKTPFDALSLEKREGKRAEPRLKIIYDRRLLQQGENVTVIAIGGEWRKVALVTCAAFDVSPDSSVFFGYHAVNAMVSKEKVSGIFNGSQPAAALIGAGNISDMAAVKTTAMRVSLEEGGVVRLECKLSDHDNHTAIAPATANFYFRSSEQEDISSTTVSMSSTTVMPPRDVTVKSTKWKYRAAAPPEENPSSASSSTSPISCSHVLLLVTLLTAVHRHWDIM